MTPNAALEKLIAKDKIRDLVLLYSRGVDRKDAALLRSLYASDAYDDHGPAFKGNAEDYVRFLENSFPHMRYSGHHVCNHLIEVEGDRGEGEVYAIAYHLLPDGKGGFVEDLICVRYLDQYRCENGRWLFARRTVTFDMRSVRPVDAPAPETPDEPSFTLLKSRLFARGARAMA